MPVADEGTAMAIPRRSVPRPPGRCRGPWSRVAAGAGALVLATSACTPGSEPAARPPSTPATSGHGSDSPGGSGRPGLSSFYDQQVRWSDCGGGFECTRVRVPVDYDSPAGRVVSLAVVRLPVDGGDRLGSLLLNPGGPGVSGVDHARAAERVVSATVRRRYDIVGFDPRGVARSAPVRCLTDRQTDASASADGSPDDAAEESRLVRLGRRLGQRCAARNAGLLAHVGTREAAQDLDVLRAVVGDRTLNYLGKSYGSYLGAVYAEMFPARVGRMVLDGVVDPAADSATLARAQAVGFERALASFVDDCLERAGCPLTGGRSGALRQVSHLLAAADRAPLRGSRPVTQSLALLGIAYAMYDTNVWTILREALAQATTGNGALLLALADVYLERQQNGHYRWNGTDAIYAVTCLDRPDTADLAVVRSRARAFAVAAPHFGAYLAWSNLPCGSWPVAAEGEPAPVQAAGAAPILVVGTTRDPATPYAFARNLAGELDSARLLTYVGDGHTAYEQGSDCIDGSVDRFLVDRVLPAEGTRCR